MEYDDRFNEVCLYFVLAWRQLPTNTGHFLGDFEALCRLYQLNRVIQSIGARYLREYGA